MIQRRCTNDGHTRRRTRLPGDRAPGRGPSAIFTRRGRRAAEHGHVAGDSLLREAAEAWNGLLRASDLLARYGGEEFALG